MTSLDRDEAIGGGNLGLREKRPMATFGAILDRYNGIGPGFDFLRIGLAVAIVLWHCTLQLGHTAVRETPFWFAEFSFVPMFLVISGFLVAGSAQRLSIGNFLVNRALRIGPALWVNILLCALILGPLLTTLALRDYFTDRKFVAFATNVVGYIHFRLPGVFETNPNPRVNTALWTVPYEILSYLVMAGLMVTGWVARPAMIGLLIVLVLAAGITVNHAGSSIPQPYLGTLDFVFVDVGSTLLVSFLLGILFYQLRSRIPHSRLLFATCVAVCVAGASFLGREAMFAVENRIVLLPALAYAVCFLGLTPIPLPRILHKGDYSYSLYLYHDPVLQTVIYLIPALTLLGLAGIPVLFLIALPLAFGFAVSSWHLVERPVLRLRKRFSFVARVRGVASEKDPATIAAPIPAENPFKTEVLGFKLSDTPR